MISLSARPTGGRIAAMTAVARMSGAPPDVIGSRLGAWRAAISGGDHLFGLLQDRWVRNDRFQIDHRGFELGQVGTRPAQTRHPRAGPLHRFGSVQQLAIAMETANQLQPKWHSVLISDTRQCKCGFGG